MMPQSRRRFIIELASFSALAALPVGRDASAYEPPLYPPIDLSYFDKPITPAPSEIRFGYHAITWGGNDRLAIKEIAELGFRGIQLRSNILKEFGDRPESLGDLLRKHELQFVAMSGGGPHGVDYAEAEAIQTQVRHIAFMREAGGLYLQMTDSSRPKDRKPAAEDFKKLARVLTEVGKRAADMGVVMAYHNHMNSLGEAPDEVDHIMDAADSRYVKLLLDVAHYTQGGGDPAAAIRKYRDRLLFLHIKDVESPVPGAANVQSRSYRFVELGRGRVDLPGVFAALKEIGFRGWAVIELDSVPDKSRTPKESAAISLKYLREKLGMKI
ncbi:MAG TPA: sugar phosphate isomerase/epimerase [Blastocatellia bacterium]|nr:sugar phosphate isomerase/epimerase [Blastocatellia bacterium]